MKDDVEEILKRYLEYLRSHNGAASDVREIEDRIKQRKALRRIDNIVWIVLASLWSLYHIVFDANLIVMAAMAAVITFMVVKTFKI